MHTLGLMAIPMILSLLTFIDAKDPCSFGAYGRQSSFSSHFGFSAGFPEMKFAERISQAEYTLRFAFVEVYRREPVNLFPLADFPLDLVDVDVHERIRE